MMLPYVMTALVFGGFGFALGWDASASRHYRKFLAAFEDDSALEFRPFVGIAYVMLFVAGALLAEMVDLPQAEAADSVGSDTGTALPHRPWTGDVEGALHLSLVRPSSDSLVFVLRNESPQAIRAFRISASLYDMFGGCIGHVYLESTQLLEAGAEWAETKRPADVSWCLGGDAEDLDRVHRMKWRLQAAILENGEDAVASPRYLFRTTPTGLVLR